MKINCKEKLFKILSLLCVMNLVNFQSVASDECIDDQNRETTLNFQVGNLRIVSHDDVQKNQKNKFDSIMERSEEIKDKFFDLIDKMGNPEYPNAADDLKNLCYQYFNIVRRNLRYIYNSPVLELLDRNNNEKLKQAIEKRLSHLQEEVKNYWQSTENNGLGIEMTSNYWGSSLEDYKIEPDHIVDISHGGGVQYILDFFDGNTLGYRLEKHGYGIQVSPKIDSILWLKDTYDRAKYYASADWHHNVTFDYSVVMYARVKAGCLFEANNIYEAGLPYYNLNQLMDIKFYFINMDNVPKNLLKRLSTYGKLEFKNKETFEKNTFE